MAIGVALTFHDSIVTVGRLPEKFRRIFQNIFHFVWVYVLLKTGSLSHTLSLSLLFCPSRASLHISSHLSASAVAPKAA